MNNEEAKFFLHAYRANGADAGDATFTPALEQARRDPLLRQWFDAQQAFDRAVSAKLGAIQPPASLRASILAGAKAGQPATRQTAWWRQPVWLAAAAGIALMLAGGLALWPKNAVAGELARFAINDTLHQNHEGHHGGEAAAFQALLSRTESRLGSGVAVDFAALRQHGCRTVSFQGHDMLEVCFKRDGKWFHCYVARCEDFPAMARKLGPTFADRNGASAGAWSDGKHIFVVASKAGRAAIQSLI